MSDLWRLVFDDERFNDMDMHHFSWGSAYKAEASDAVAVVRRGVESGEIGGEVTKVEHDYYDHHANDGNLVKAGTYLVIPIGGSE